MDLVCRHTAHPGSERRSWGKRSDPAGAKGATRRWPRPACNAGHGRSHDRRIGDDDFGQRLLNGLTQHGVGRAISRLPSVSSGAHLSWWTRRERTRSWFPPGQAKLTPKTIDAAEQCRLRAVVVLQHRGAARYGRACPSRCASGWGSLRSSIRRRCGGLARAMYGVDVFTPTREKPSCWLVRSERTA